MSAGVMRGTGTERYPVFDELQTLSSGSRGRCFASLKHDDSCARWLEKALTMSGGSGRSVVDSLESW